MPDLPTSASGLNHHGHNGNASLLKFELREAGPGCLVLTCHGGLSWEDRELLAASVEQYLTGRDTVHGLVLDMAAVEFVNSAGLGALFQLIQRLRGRGARLAFANVPPTIHRVLMTVGMVRLAAFGRDVPDALALLNPPAAPTVSQGAEWSGT
jgi:anti-anti-sigma factor